VKYTVEAGDRSFDIEIEGGRIVVDGRAVEARLSGAAGTVIRSLVHGRRNRAILAQSEAPGQWTLGVAGYRLAVQVLDARARALRAAGSGNTRQAATGILKAPMPGLVLRVLAQEGDTVEAGQGLVVIEAMKMENELKAPRAGTVAKVQVAPGARVEKGALLIELS
jgi:pyruvate carboxylase subunit B